MPWHASLSADTTTIVAVSSPSKTIKYIGNDHKLHFLNRYDLFTSFRSSLNWLCYVTDCERMNESRDRPRYGVMPPPPAIATATDAAVTTHTHTLLRSFCSRTDENVYVLEQKHINRWTGFVLRSINWLKNVRRMPRAMPLNGDSSSFLFSKSSLRILKKTKTKQKSENEYEQMKLYFLWIVRDLVAMTSPPNLHYFEKRPVSIDIQIENLRAYTLHSSQYSGECMNVKRSAKVQWTCCYVPFRCQFLKNHDHTYEISDMRCHRLKAAFHHSGSVDNSQWWI